MGFLFGNSKINSIKKRYSVIVNESSKLLSEIYKKEAQLKEIHLAMDETDDIDLSLASYVSSSMASLNDEETRTLKEMRATNEKLYQCISQIDPLIDELDELKDAKALSLRADYSSMRDTLTATYSRIRRVFNENINN